MKKYAVLMAFLLMAFFDMNAQTTISIANATALTGSNVTVPVTVTNFNNIGSVSLQINFNSSVIEYVEVQNSKLAGYLVGQGAGYIRFGWYSSTPVNLGDSKLFDLVFLYKGGTTNVSFDASVQTEIRDDNGVKLNATYNNGSVELFTGLPAPSLLTPSNGATNQNLSLQLDWSNVTDATLYDVQVSTVNTFATTLVNQSNLTESIYSIGSGVLSNSTTYYWRAKGKNGSSDGNWSSTFSFTTISAAAINVKVTAENVTAFPNTRITVPINVENFDKVDAITLRLNFDKTKLTYVGFENPVKSDFLVNVSDNVINIAWIDMTTTNPLTISSGKLLDLVFDYTSTNTAISFNTSDCEISSRVNLLNVSYVNGGVTESAPLPVEPVLVSPADVSTNISLTPTLTWNNVNTATSYSMQVSTVIDFSSLIVNQTGLTATQTTLSTSLNRITKYYWRVRATNSVGTGNWSAVWSFTTLNPPLAVPTLSSPANGSVDVSFTPSLDWSDVAEATSYRVQVSASSDFAVLTMDTQNVTVSEMVVTSGLLTRNTKYYWRVNATDGTRISDWSSVNNFTTINPPLAVPTLTAPATGSVDVSLTPTLDWTDVAEATSYRVQISASSDFVVLTGDYANLTSSEYKILESVLAENTMYYWRVNATDGTRISNWSSVFNFTTLTLILPTPVLVLPANLSTGVLLADVVFDWSDVATATNYDLQIATDELFASIVDQQNTSVSTYTLPAGKLNYETRYYWRVKAKNSTKASVWTEPWTFLTVVKPLDIPVLSSPANNALNLGLTPTLKWGGVTSATSYSVQLSLNETFSTTLINETNVTAAQIIVASNILNFDTKYFWRVKAKTATKESDWSVIWNFTTELGPLPAPGLIAPANGATNVKVDLTLDWNNVVSATGYGLQIATDEAFTALSIDATNLTESIYSIPPGILATGTMYYWRVNASDATRLSEWSEHRSFKTEGPNDVQKFMSGVPEQFGLFQNYPNPFNPSTKIRYSLPEVSQVKIEVVDLLGRTVAVLLNESQSAGFYEFDWNADNLTSGTYIYRLNAKSESGKEFSEMKKMMFIK